MRWGAKDKYWQIIRFNVFYRAAERGSLNFGRKGGEEELKERGERVCKVSWSDERGKVARPVKFYCRTRRPPNEFAWKFAVRTAS